MAEASRPENFTRDWGECIGTLGMDEREFDVYTNKAGELLIRGFAFGKDAVFAPKADTMAEAQTAAEGGQDGD